MTSKRGENSPVYGRRTARLYEPFMAAVTFGRYRPFLAREVANLGLRPADRILDLCCGTGLLSREMARRLGPDGEVVGVDVSEAMLEQAKRGAGKPPAGGKVIYVRAEADALPLPDGRFDYATVFLGLHEIAQAARLPALREVRRVLRPGGRGLAFDFASGGPSLRRGGVRLALSALEGPEAWTITDPGVAALLAQADLRPEKPRPVFLGVLEVVGFVRS